MRHTFAVVVSIVLGCGGSKPLTRTGPDRRMDLLCTPQADFDEAACAARGCHYEPQLICRGVAVDEQTRMQEQREREAGAFPCQCVCAEDVKACSTVP